MFYRNKLDNIILNGGKFNCFLFFNPAGHMKNLRRSGQLIIELKVHLEADNTVSTIGPFADNRNLSFKTGPWPEKVLKSFKAVYQRTGQAFWDNRFILTNGSYRDFDLYFVKDKKGKMIDRTKLEVPPMITADAIVDGVRVTPEEHNFRIQHNIYFLDDSAIITVHPDIECRFILKLVDTAGEAHTSIKVSYFTHVKAPGKSFQRIPANSYTYFRSSSGHYSQSDLLTEVSYFGNIPLRQQPHLHEIGHSLGMKHSGVVLAEPRCMAQVASSDENAPACYGTTFRSASNILGQGNLLEPFNAEPWKHCIKLLSKSDTWNVKMRYS